MNIIVNINSLKPGDYFTVLNWVGPDNRPTANKSYVGVVLKMVYAEGPFVFANARYGSSDKFYQIRFDSRDCVFIRVTDEYVKTDEKIHDQPT